MNYIILKMLLMRLEIYWVFDMMVEMYCCNGKCSKYIGTLFTNHLPTRTIPNLEWFCPKCIEAVKND